MREVTLGTLKLVLRSRVTRSQMVTFPKHPLQLTRVVYRTPINLVTKGPTNYSVASMNTPGHFTSAFEFQRWKCPGLTFPDFLLPLQRT